MLSGMAEYLDPKQRGKTYAKFIFMEFTPDFTVERFGCDPAVQLRVLSDYGINWDADLLDWWSPLTSNRARGATVESLQNKKSPQTLAKSFLFLHRGGRYSEKP